MKFVIGLVNEEVLIDLFRAWILHTVSLKEQHLFTFVEIEKDKAYSIALHGASDELTNKFKQKLTDLKIKWSELWIERP